MMNLRELMTERIMFAVTEEELIAQYNVGVDELETLSDLDFLEIYEEISAAVGQ